MYWYPFNAGMQPIPIAKKTGKQSAAGRQTGACTVIKPTMRSIKETPLSARQIFWIVFNKCSYNIVARYFMASGGLAMIGTRLSSSGNPSTTRAIDACAKRITSTFVESSFKALATMWS